MPKFINLSVAVDKLTGILTEKMMFIICYVLDQLPTIEYPPCNIGDTIYEPYLDKVMQYTVNEIKITTSGTVIGVVGDFEKEFRISVENLGKTFFLTYEEAEERLVREKEE